MKATGFRFKINDISKKIDRIDSKLKELEKYILGSFDTIVYLPVRNQTNFFQHIFACNCTYF